MRTIVFSLCLLATAALSAQTTVAGTIQSGGLTREYLLYVPAIYTGATAVPLVINLHGYTSNNLEQELYGDFRSIADTANFLIIHPNGTLDGQGNRFWNTFGGSNVDDIGFISNLIDSLQAVYNIDPNRIYATGMSNGGFMSYALACGLNNRIAAIGSVAGSMTAPNFAACHPSRPVPVMEIHGDADATVPYTGGTVLNFTPIPNLVDFWVNANHCAPPLTILVPNTNTSDGCTAVRYLYLNGDLGSTVEHYKILGGGHTWPGAAFNIGVTNQDISASREIWRFFRQYTLDQLTATQEPITTATHWLAFPNPANDYVLVQPVEAGADSPQRIRVYDALGKLIQSVQPVGQSAIRLPTTNWPNGLYTLIIESSGKSEQLRIVKENK